MKSSFKRYFKLMRKVQTIHYKLDRKQTYGSKKKYCILSDKKLNSETYRKLAKHVVEEFCVKFLFSTKKKKMNSHLYIVRLIPYHLIRKELSCYFLHFTGT